MAARKIFLPIVVPATELRRHARSRWRWMPWALLPLLAPFAAGCGSMPSGQNRAPSIDAMQDLTQPPPVTAVAARLDSSERAARRALRAERALRGARAMFTAEEAEVLVTASGIRVRLLEPLFIDGSSRFNDAAADRIGRLRAAIALFPDPKVVIHAPEFAEGSRPAMVEQMRAAELRAALLRANVAPQERIFSRLDTHGVKTLEIAVSNDSSFDEGRSRGVAGL